MTGVLAAAALGAGLRAEVVDRVDEASRAGQRIDAMPLQSRPDAPVRWLVLQRSGCSDMQGTVASGLRALLAGWLAPLPAGQRNAVVAMLARATAEAVDDPYGTSMVLHSVRQALRERLSRPPDRFWAASATAIHRLSDRHVHVSLDLLEPVTDGAVVAVSPEGHRVALPVSSAGAGVACCQLESPSRLGTGWLLERRVGKGTAWEEAVPDVTAEPLAVMATLADQWRSASPPCSPDPAVWAELRGRLWAGACVLVDQEYGEVPPSPHSSMAVLLSDDIAEAEHHLVPFLDSTGAADVELLFVVSGGCPSVLVLAQLEELHRLYQVPFRVLVPDRRVDHELGSWLATGRAHARLDRVEAAEGTVVAAPWKNDAGTTGPRRAGSITSAVSPRRENHGFL